MSHEAFLRTIITQPDDDLLRLVYADWLDENDDPARAEFIRVQCELAHLPDDDERRPRLEDREHELLSEHEPAWLGSELVGLQEWEFQRGFLHSITIGLDDLLSWQEIVYDLCTVRDCTLTEQIGSASPEDLLDCPFLANLMSLNLSRISIEQPIYRLLEAKAFPALKRLDFSNNSGLHQGGELLREWPTMRYLKSLSVGGTNHGVEFYGTLDVRQLANVLNHSQLNELSVFNCRLTSDSLLRLLRSPFMTHLKSLDISDNPIAGEGWQTFRDANSAMRLNRLDISETPLGSDAINYLLGCQCLENLTELEINGCATERSAMQALARSAYWHYAKVFRAHSGNLSGKKLESLCRATGSPNLTLLDLASNGLRPNDIRLLCEAPWAGTLTWLALSGNHLDYQSVKLLATSGRFQNLRTLHLANNSVDAEAEIVLGDNAAISLAKAKSLANLCILTLDESFVTDRGVEALINSPNWKLAGLGLGGCELTPRSVHVLVKSPRLTRLNWLDLSRNTSLFGDGLLPLAESPYLSRLCELDIRGCGASDRVRQILRERLGPRLSD